MEKVLIGELPKLSHSLRLSTKATISVFQDKTSSAVLSLTDMLTYSIKIKTGTTAQLPKRCIEKMMKAASSSQAAHICLNMLLSVPVLKWALEHYTILIVIMACYLFR